jgi:hypothetical protein
VIEARVPGAGRSAHITSGPPRTHPCNLWAQRLDELINTTFYEPPHDIRHCQAGPWLVS